MKYQLSKIIVCNGTDSYMNYEKHYLYMILLKCPTVDELEWNSVKLEDITKRFVMFKLSHVLTFFCQFRRRVGKSLVKNSTKKNYTQVTMSNK